MGDYYSLSDLLASGWEDGVEVRAFQAFMKKVNRMVTNLTGMDVRDFADANWADLFDDVGPDVTQADVVETLSEADDLFAAMVAEVGL